MALLAPQVGILREWAYAGFTFDLLAAVLSHGLSGDGIGRAAGAVFTLGLLLASYLLRRRMPAYDLGLPRRAALSARAPTEEAITRERKPMTPALRLSVWFGRLVLAAATILFS